MSYKSEWEAILKLGDFSSDLVQDYSDKLSSLSISTFSIFDDGFKKDILKEKISNIDHIHGIIDNSNVMQTRKNIYTELGSRDIKYSSFYKLFRAAVLANKKPDTKQQITRDDLLDPEEVLELPHNSSRPQISMKIFIRDCYRTLLDILLTSESNYHVLLGAPGVGKSHFALYFVYTLIRLGIPFIFDSNYNEEKVKFYMLKSDGYLVCNDITSILDELGDQFFWYVVDGCQPREFLDNKKSKCLFIDSPNLKDYLTFSSQYFFPCWTLDEIEKCINKCSITRITEPEDNPLYKQLFKIVGGVPRYVFISTIEKYKYYIKCAVIDCDILVLIKSVNYRVFLDKYISKLVQPIVNSKLELLNVEFVSDYVVEDLVNVRESEILNEMTTLISMIGNREPNAIASRIFETLMIRKFKEGNREFFYRRLQDKNQSTFSVPELEEIIFDENNLMSDLQSQVKLENHKRVLLVPKNKTLDAADAFMLPNICLKFTVKQNNHYIAASKNFKNILDVMREFSIEKKLLNDVEGGDNFKFKYIFVVPDSLYENFGSQAVKCNENLTEQALEKAKNETDETDTTYKSMKTDLEVKINEQIVQHVLKVEI